MNSPRADIPAMPKGHPVLAFDLRHATAEQIRAAVDWDRDVLPYVEMILDRTRFVSKKPKEEAVPA